MFIIFETVRRRSEYALRIIKIRSNPIKNERGNFKFQIEHRNKN